jgi:hypothetical protein
MRCNLSALGTFGTSRGAGRVNTQVIVFADGCFDLKARQTERYRDGDIPSAEN